MSDGFGNVIESLAMLMQATGEVVFQINPLIKSKEYDPETGGLEIKTVDKVGKEHTFNRMQKPV
jgi:hypothetical protein